MNQVNRCIYCGQYIPEGRLVCPTCEKDRLKFFNYSVNEPRRVLKMGSFIGGVVVGMILATIVFLFWVGCH